MKKMLFFAIITILAVATATGIILAGCCHSEEEAAFVNPPPGKILIAYYSESPNRNTRVIAEWIQQQVGGELFAIEPETAYPAGYRELLKAAKAELDAGTEPPIKPFAGNLAEFDVIFIGSPIWYGTFAPPVGTFLTALPAAGKTIVPFCSHGGGGAGNFFNAVAAKCPAAKVLDGFAGQGSNQVERLIGRGVKSKSSPNEVIVWLNRLSY